MLEDIKIIKWDKGYRIVDITGYNYETSGSIEVLGCIFNIYEKTLLEKIKEFGNNVDYYDFQNDTKSCEEDYYKFYFDVDSYITPLVSFETYEKAQQVLDWLNENNTESF